MTASRSRGLPRPSKRVPSLLCAILLGLAALLPQPAAAAGTPVTTEATSGNYLWGVGGNDGTHLADERAHGVNVQLLELHWYAYEPSDGNFDTAWVSRKKAELAAMRQQGFQVVLDLGLQYPPNWVFNYPNSRYVNQYGDTFTGSGQGSASGGVNFVFNTQMRSLDERYVARAFADFGGDFVAVRLGWNYLGEMNYPLNNYNGHSNSYWAFDANALKQLPTGSWRPGQHTSSHDEANRFINWYLDKLKECQQWQIATVRKYYSGGLAILYPSWGVRPGQLAGAVQHDLDGSTSVEICGELQRGFDFERLVAAASSDRNVIVWTTWIEADHGQDSGSNQAEWSPAKYLSSLAQAHGLRSWGENAGGNNDAEMHTAAAHVANNHMMGMMWMHESDLYSGNGCANIRDYQERIDIYRTIVRGNRKVFLPATLRF